MRDIASTREPMQKSKFEKAVLDIFLNEDYYKILDMTERVRISFELSNDDTFPFVYTSCKVLPQSKAH